MHLHRIQTEIEVLALVCGSTLLKATTLGLSHHRSLQLLNAICLWIIITLLLLLLRVLFVIRPRVERLRAHLRQLSMILGLFSVNIAMILLSKLCLTFFAGFRMLEVELRCLVKY